MSSESKSAEKLPLLCFCGDLRVRHVLGTNPLSTEMYAENIFHYILLALKLYFLRNFELAPVEGRAPNNHLIGYRFLVD